MARKNPLMSELLNRLFHRNNCGLLGYSAFEWAQLYPYEQREEVLNLSEKEYNSLVRDLFPKKKKA